MNHQSTTTLDERRIGGGVRFGLLMAAIVGATMLLLMLPALGHAKKANFGADLTQPGIDPVHSPVPCKWNNASCTRLPLFYAAPPHAGLTPYAPKSGVIKKIKLIAKNPGKLRLQFGDASSQGQPTGEVTANGPKIQYQGTGAIEKFKVHIPVTNFSYIGFKTKLANTLSCDQPGLESSYQFDPILKPGHGPQVSSWQEECTHLISARMKY